MTVRDIGSEYLQELQEQAAKDLAEGFVPESDEQKEVEESPYLQLFTKITPTWSYADKNAIEQLKVVSTRLFFDIFGDALNILDDFYATLREPEVNEHGAVVMDSDGRPVWQRTATGDYIENWSLLNGQDLEKCLFDLQRLKMIVTDRCSELFLEAVFARHISKDEYSAGYEKLMDGQVGEREARARRDSVKERYHAFFRYYLWYRTNNFLNELRETMRILERTRQWRLMEEK